MRGTQFAQLTAFAAVAEHSSFTRAAAQLGISVPSLSQAISLLEEQLGVRLLNRATRSVALTEAGQELLGHLAPAMEGVDRAIDAMNAFRDKPAGTLRLAVHSIATMTVVAPLVARFSAARRERGANRLNSTSCTDMTMHYASVHRRAGLWPKEKAAGALTLDFDTRHRRRVRLTTDQGEDVLLNLPKAVAMADGDGLQLEDRRWLKVRAAAELIVEVRHRDPNQLMRLAWHLGNRHLPTEFRNQALRIRPDHVIEDMLHGFGADLLKVQAPFQPGGGAYSSYSHHHNHDDRGHHHE